VIVVDTNILVYALIAMPETSLVREVAAIDPDWVVPPLWKYEFISALVTLVRGRALTAAQAEASIADAERLASPRELDTDLISAFRAASTFDLSAYDGTFIALAQDLNVRCVTADGRMLRNASTIAISPTDFVAARPPP
jgi:predicted nucleic acid-binding protein